MKKLSEHNQDSDDFLQKLRNISLRAGVACDKCGKEMFYYRPDVQLSCMPPKQAVMCECGHEGYKK